METATKATAELCTRPADEHHTLATFSAASNADRTNGREIKCRARSILFSEDSESLLGVSIDVGGYEPAGMTHYALGQACAAAGTNPSLLARVQPLTRVRILNEALDREQMSDRVALYDTGKDAIRALTSERYSRLWDAEILDQINEWLLPCGWIPAVPTFRSIDGRNMRGNDKPALFRGDRDSFAFFYSPETTRDDLGGLRTGLMFGNSEVGARRFSWDVFTFRNVCGNFMVHGIGNVQRHEARHVGEIKRVFRALREKLRTLSLDMDSERIRMFEVACNAMFAEQTATGTAQENAAKRLNRQYKTPNALAQRIAKAATLPINKGNGQDDQRLSIGESAIDYFAIANGASWLAYEAQNADDKAELATLAGTIIEGAGA
jgi:hypothetical protein